MQELRRQYSLPSHQGSGHAHEGSALKAPQPGAVPHLRNDNVRRRLLMVREALTALAVAVFVSGTLGVLIYLGAKALMDSIFL